MSSPIELPTTTRKAFSSGVRKRSKPSFADDVFKDSQKQLLVRPAAVADHHQLFAVAAVIGVGEIREVEQVEDLERMDVAGVGAEEHLRSAVVVGGLDRHATGFGPQAS